MTRNSQICLWSTHRNIRHLIIIAKIQYKNFVNILYVAYYRILHSRKLKQLGIFSNSRKTWGPIYKISYDLSQDYREFIVRSTYDSDLGRQRAKGSLENIVS